MHGLMAIFHCVCEQVSVVVVVGWRGSFPSSAAISTRYVVGWLVGCWVRIRARDPGEPTSE